MAILWGLEFGHLVIQAGLVCASPPEVLYAYSGAEFNDQFGPAAVVKLARERAAARLARKEKNFARYQRRHDQWCRNVYQKPWKEFAAERGITGTRPESIILDDVHAEATPEQRKILEAWHNKPPGDAPR